jgi:hypothetical protein
VNFKEADRLPDREYFFNVVNTVCPNEIVDAIKRFGQQEKHEDHSFLVMIPEEFIVLLRSTTLNGGLSAEYSGKVRDPTAFEAKKVKRAKKKPAKGLFE